MMTTNTLENSTSRWRIRKIVAASLYLFLFITTVLGVFAGSMYWRFSASIPVAEYGEPQTTLEARLQDLDYLSNLPQVDYSFSDTEEQQFHAFLETLKTRVANLSDAEFAMQVARAVALSKNGHTTAPMTRITKDMNSLPVRFYWFADGLHIVRTRASHGELLGARVVSYNGQAPESIVSQLAPFHSGTEHLRHYESPLLFSSPEALHAAGITDSADMATLQVALRDGSTKTVTLNVEEKPTGITFVDDVALPLPSKNETESKNPWLRLDYNTVTQAHYAKNPENKHWSEPLPNGGMYMSLRNTWDGTALKTLFTDVETALSSKPADYLVIDLRSNWGGDYTKSMGFMRKVSDLVTDDGKVYILTNGGTFSAAIVTTAFALHGAGDKGVIVGSHVGDDDQFWAESGASMQLPNSGIKVAVATGYHDWENGCSDWSDCFWINILFGVASGPLDPHIEAPLTFADYAKGIDTTLQAVFTAQEKQLLSAL
jgi:hypothetical protein